MRCCELNRIDYLFGLARNERLTAAIAAELQEAQQLGERTGKPARRFKDLTWSTLDSWSRARRVVAKAEWTGGEANPRFVVTSLSRTEHEARHLYEKVYCARGDMENDIKECQLDLFADRTSAATMRANQLRLWFAAMASCWFARCAASPSGTPSSPRPPAAPFVSSCSRSGRWYGSASAASKSPWPPPAPIRTSSPSPICGWPRQRADYPEPPARHSSIPACGRPSPALRPL
jgi:Transposase DDE domain group 1